VVERVNRVERAAEPAEWPARVATGIQSVEHGIGLLRALADANGPLTLTALAVATGMAPGKAHKYLVSYIRGGLVTQKGPGGRYDLGPTALELGLAVMRRMDLMEVAQAALDNLRDRLGTTASMAVWANHGPTIVRWAETPHIMSLTIRIGTLMPLLNSAFGRVFAAFLDRRLTQDIIRAEIADPEGPAARAGLRTLADVDRLLAEFRSRRMTVAENLVDPGRAALGAPVFDYNERVVAAIAVIGVQGQLDTSWDGAPARELALCVENLSRRLGAQKPPFA
jgi:DNA-binding IclR family transcriptional regulator